MGRTVSFGSASFLRRNFVLRIDRACSIHGKPRGCGTFLDAATPASAIVRGTSHQEVTNTTVVNTETMCELLRKIAAQGLAGPITLVLDNARYQRNAVVQASAESLGIALLFLPSYSPNLNLIERLWKFIKRRAIYGRYHPTFAEFRAAVEETIDQLPTTHAESLASLMTLNFQRFENVSLMAA